MSGVPWRRRSSRRRVPFHSVFMLSALILMMLVPIGADAAADEVAARQQELAQATEEPTEESGDEGLLPEEEPTEELVPEEEPSEELLPAEENELLGAIEIDYWECEPGYDIANPDLANLFDHCEGVDGVPFYVATSDGGQQSQQTGEFGDAHVSFTELPTGSTTFGQSNPDNRPVAAFCNGIVQNGGPETGTMSMSISSGSTQWDLQDEEIVFCSWLVANEAEPVDLIIEKRLCPVGYDVSDQDADLATDCAEPMDGVTFVAEGPDDYNAQTDTGDSRPSAVMFGGLVPGDYTITETMPEGIASSFIWDCTIEGSLTPIRESPLADGPTFEYRITGKGNVTCYWFNVPEDTGTPSPDVDDGNSVTVYKWLCPAGTAYDLAIDDYSAACDQEHLNIPISLTDANGERATTTQANGTQWDDVVPVDGDPDDAVFLAEEIPDGFGEPVVFCQALDQDEWRLYEVEQGSFTLDDFGADNPWTVQCNWYNVPSDNGTPSTLDEGEGSDVTLTKYYCPEGTDYGLDWPALAEQCNESGPAAEFFLNVPTAGYSESGTTNSDTPPAAVFANVPFGQLFIEETVLEGYQWPRVFCSDTPSDGMGNFQELMPGAESEAGAFTWNHAPDASSDLNCIVFNIPGDDYSVTVYKWLCPVETAYGLSIDEYGAACDQEHLDIPITLSDASGDRPMTTQANGTEWDKVTSGDQSFTITETIPDGFGTPVVFCGTLDDEEVAPMAVMEGAIHFNGFTGDVQCFWYNIPLEEGFGEVAINKHACPAGIDAYSLDIYELAAQCHEDPGTVAFTVTSGAYSETVNASGGGAYASFINVPSGTVTVTENLPDGYGTPIVYCKVELMLDLTDVIPTYQETVTDGPSIAAPLGNEQLLWCDWYNVPDDGSEITIVKYVCPEGTDYDHDQEWFQNNCTERPEGIQFRLTHSGGAIDTATDNNGEISWTEVPIGPFSIQEYLPSDYGEPVVFCGWTATFDGAVLDAFPQLVASPGGYVTGEINYPNTQYVCHWYNIPGGPGEVTIFKYTCPEGYDLYAWEAKPAEDCSEGTNGITFNADGPDGYQNQTDTGDSVEFAVYFGGLEPGDYTFTESVPEDIAYVFVLDCYGQHQGELRPYPLSMGPELTVEVGADEAIVCYWYNVPEDPHGRLTVYKHVCSTKVYVSEVDCEIFEDGQGFDLVMWDGDSWGKVNDGTTDGGGKLSWAGLDPGEYWLDEQGGEWCHIRSEQMSDDGNWLNVYDGEETVVHVYNCTSEPGKPGGKPTKYPDTGVPPVDGGPGAPAELPAVAALLGLALTRRRLLALGGGVGITALAGSVVAQGEQVIEPEGTPGGTPASLCLAATPDDATPADGSDCFRGAVPHTLQIEAIGVDAPVEILETVGGVMQQPSDEVHVAWYKETARLGETGNIVLAGHLNWWGVPEAVFFNLAKLQEGDAVTLLAEDGTAYAYTVEWVRQESNLEPPSEEVLGMTDHEAVTLITCGGEWDSSISEYDERTVARARRAPDPGTPAA